MTLTRHQCVRQLFGLLLVLALAAPALAQQPITFQYFYDNVGRLAKVVDSTGVVIEYVYDKVGNIVEVKRSSVSGLAIFNFTPQRGAAGAQVTIQGQGFSANPTENIVRFNGTSAAVTSATTTTLVVTVPVGATTGPISVQVGAVTAVSSRDFTVTQQPVITSVSPKAVLAGTTFVNLQVTGRNLTGATFSFAPAFLPLPIIVNTVSVDPSGASATVNVTIGSQAGQFVVVATNADGSSSTSPTPGNTLGVVDPQRTGADDDGDGFPSGLELILGSNPFDRASVPSPQALSPTSTAGSTFSVVNIIAPPIPSGLSTTETSSVSFSVVNTIAPPPAPGLTSLEATGPMFSIVNTIPPPSAGLTTQETASAVFSVVNTLDPGQPLQTNEAASPLFSIQNQAGQ